MNLYLWDSERYILVAAENVQEARATVLKNLGQSVAVKPDYVTAVSHQVATNEPLLYGQGSVIIVNPKEPKPETLREKAPAKVEAKPEKKQETLF